MQPKALRLIGCLLVMELMCQRGPFAAPTSGTPLSSVEQRIPDVRVLDAWIRWLPADIPAGGYLTLINDANTNRVLIAVTSADYGDIGIHQSLDDHGVSKMRPVDSITLKPHVPCRFSEGGYHLMLMQPRRVLHPGDDVVMTLRFRDGATLDAVFKVRAGG